MAQDDRRQFPRYDAQLPVRIGLDDASQTEGATQNVSEGGVAITVGRGLEAGGRVEVELPPVDGEAGTDPVKTMATVMWSEETDSGAFRVGLRFDPGSPHTQEHLRRLVNKLDGSR